VGGHAPVVVSARQGAKVRRRGSNRPAVLVDRDAEGASRMVIQLGDRHQVPIMSA
jgi:hypothetical protein